MKLRLFILLFSFKLAFGQSISLEPARGSALFRGIDNYFQLAEDDIECSALLVKGINCEIELDSCMLKVRPNNADNCKIFISHISNRDTFELLNKSYRVTELPKPEPRMYHISSGSIQKEAVKKGEIELENTASDLVGCGVILPVRSYKVVILRNDTLIGFSNNPQAEHTTETKALLNRLEPMDEVIFFDIIGSNFYQEDVNLKSIKFEIGE